MMARLGTAHHRIAQTGIGAIKLSWMVRGRVTEAMETRDACCKRRSVDRSGQGDQPDRSRPSGCGFCTPHRQVADHLDCGPDPLPAVGTQSLYPLGLLQAGNADGAKPIAWVTSPLAS